jgi:hypothetical protein
LPPSFPTSLEKAESASTSEAQAVTANAREVPLRLLVEVGATGKVAEVAEKHGGNGGRILNNV